MSSSNSVKIPEQLLSQGYVFIPCTDPDTFNAIIARMKATNDAADPVDYPPKSDIEGPISAEVTSGWYGTRQQRESWFISPSWPGPFDDDPATIARIMRDSVDAELPGILATGHSYAACPWAMGVHSYKPALEGVEQAEEGLHEHIDVDTVTILGTDGPLKGFVDGEWVSITIPDDHFMVFIGIIGAAAHGGTPLLHRVPYCTKPKFSVGLFIGPDFEQPVSETCDLTVGDVYAKYFAGGEAQVTDILVKEIRGE